MLWSDDLLEVRRHPLLPRRPMDPARRPPPAALGPSSAFHWSLSWPCDGATGLRVRLPCSPPLGRSGFAGLQRQEVRPGQAPHPSPALPRPASGRRRPLRDAPRRHRGRIAGRRQWSHGGWLSQENDPVDLRVVEVLDVVPQQIRHPAMLPRSPPRSSPISLTNHIGAPPGRLGSPPRWLLRRNSHRDDTREGDTPR